MARGGRWKEREEAARSLNYPNTFHRGMFKLNAKLDAYALLYSVTLYVMATQYTCSLNNVYHPHWLVQWSHCSCMCIPVHPPSLPGYIDVVQTVLVILTMARHFLDRPYMCPDQGLNPHHLQCSNQLNYPACTVFHFLNLTILQVMRSVPA